MPPPTTKYLVICGAPSPSPSPSPSSLSFFSTFLGFNRALKLLSNVEGDFWSSFPILKYFNTQNESIQFSFPEEEEQEPIEIYTKAAFDHGERFWKQFPAEGFSEEVLKYVGNQCEKLGAGDVFDLVLIGRGTEEGTCLGGKDIAE